MTLLLVALTIVGPVQAAQPKPTDPPGQAVSPTPAPPAAKPAGNTPSPARPEGRIGLKLLQRKSVCFVQEVIPGSPADHAGILAGERLYAVNGTSLDGLSLRQITDQIKGEPSTEVHLTLKRTGQAPREVTLTRAVLVDPKPVIKTAPSALPRVRAFASRGELKSLETALQELAINGPAADYAEGLALTIGALASAYERSITEKREPIQHDLESKQKAEVLLEQIFPAKPSTKSSAAHPPAVSAASVPSTAARPSKSPSSSASLSKEELARARTLAQSRLELPEAIQKLYLRALEPSAEPSGTTENPQLALVWTERAIKLLLPQSDNRTVARTLSAWYELQALAQLRLGNTAVANQAQTRSQEILPGYHAARLTRAGKVSWSARLGAPDRWEARLKQLQSPPPPKTPDPSSALTFAGSILRYEAQATAQAVLDLSLQTTTDPALKQKAEVLQAEFSHNLWKVAGEPAPDVALTPVLPAPLKTIDGNELAGPLLRPEAIKLSSLKGKVVLISLWATWCGPCHRELEAFKALYEQLKPKGLEILAISVDEDTDAVAPFVIKKQLTFPAGLAQSRPPLFRTSNVPVTFLTDRTGALVYSHVGYSESAFAELVDKIQELLADPDDAPQPLLADGWKASRWQPLGYSPLRRTIDVAIAQGPQGPQIWALQATGVLEILEPPQTSVSEPDTLPVLQGAGSRSGYAGFTRVTPVDPDGDRISDIAAWKPGDGDVVVESAWSELVKLYLPSPHALVEVAPLEAVDGTEALVLAYSDAGVRIVNPEGLDLAWNQHLRPTGLASRGRGSDFELIVPQEEGGIRLLSREAVVRTTLDPKGSAWRALAYQDTSKGPQDILVLDRSVGQPVLLDLDGDGLQELAALYSGNVVVLDHTGALLSRLSLEGSRFSLAGGDVNDDGRDELIIGGEGLGVLVLGLTPQKVP